MGRAQLASITFLPGMLLIALGFALLNPQASMAQTADAEYEGVRECRSCHRGVARDFATGAHSQTLLNTEDEEVTPLADFSTGETIRSVQFPGDSEARPFTANDVAYTLGSGTHIQRYLYQVEEGMYMVFPAEWNTQTGEWQAYDTGEAWPGESYDFNQNCAYCHVTAFESDTLTWDDEGVQCEACHGPGSEHVILMDDLGFILNEEDREELHASINIAIDPAICGQCHSQGISDSAHAYPDGYRPGDDLSASFTPVAEDAEGYWHPTGQASQTNMQYNEWLLSGHANSYDTAIQSDAYELECLTCHSSGYRRAIRLLETSDEDPEALPLPEVEAERLPFGVTCSTCHNPHDVPGEDEEFDLVAHNYMQCTSCHQSAGEVAGLHHPVKEIFEGLPLIDEVEPVVSVHFSAEEGPVCTTCHMPVVPVGDSSRNSHILNPVSPGMAVDVEAVQDSCTTCHELVDGQSMQELIDAVQDATQTRYDTAMTALGDDTPEWVSNALMVVANEGSLGVHNVNYTGALLNAVEVELGLREAGTAPLVLPPIHVHEPDEVAQTQQAELETVFFGLTPASLVVLSIAFGIIIIAGVSFFRGGDA